MHFLRFALLRLHMLADLLAVLALLLGRLVGEVVDCLIGVADAFALQRGNLAPIVDDDLALIGVGILVDLRGFAFSRFGLGLFLRVARGRRVNCLGSRPRQLGRHLLGDLGVRLGADVGRKRRLGEVALRPRRPAASIVAAGSAETGATKVLVHLARLDVGLAGVVLERFDLRVALAREVRRCHPSGPCPSRRGWRPSLRSTEGRSPADVSMLSSLVLIPFVKPRTKSMKASQKLPLFSSSSSFSRIGVGRNGRRRSAIETGSRIALAGAAPLRPSARCRWGPGSAGRLGSGVNRCLTVLAPSSGGLSAISFCSPFILASTVGPNSGWVAAIADGLASMKAVVASSELPPSSTFSTMATCLGRPASTGGGRVMSGSGGASPNISPVGGATSWSSVLERSIGRLCGLGCGCRPRRFGRGRFPGRFGRFGLAGLAPDRHQRRFGEVHLADRIEEMIPARERIPAFLDLAAEIIVAGRIPVDRRDADHLGRLSFGILGAFEAGHHGEMIVGDDIEGDVALSRHLSGGPKLHRIECRRSQFPVRDRDSGLLHRPPGEDAAPAWKRVLPDLASVGCGLLDHDELVDHRFADRGPAEGGQEIFAEALPAEALAVGPSLLGVDLADLASRKADRIQDLGPYSIAFVSAFRLGLQANDGGGLAVRLDRALLHRVGEFMCE